MVRALVLLLALVVVIVGVRFVRLLARGKHEVGGWLTGNFDDTPLGRLRTGWFSERPQREEHRQLFVFACRAFRCADGVFAEGPARCTTSVWADERAAFGDRLAKELDRLVVFDPELAVSEEAMLRAKEEFRRWLDRLRALDETSPLPPSCRS